MPKTHYTDRLRARGRRIADAMSAAMFLVAAPLVLSMAVLGETATAAPAKDDTEGRTSVTSMTYRQIENRLDDIADDMKRLNGRAEKEGGLLDEDEVRFEQLSTEFDELLTRKKALERESTLLKVSRAKVASAAGRTGAVVRGSDDMDTDPLGEPDSIEDCRFRNPWDTSEVRMGLSPTARGSELRSRALSAIPRMQGTTDRAREVMTDIIERFDTSDSRIAAQLLASSSPEYLRAYGKIIRAAGNLSAAALEPAELGAYQRAMSLTDAAGGYLVPFQLDPNVILTASGSVNNIRQIARVVQGTSDTWNGVSSAGVTASWDAEAAEVSDDSPTLAQPSIPVYKLQVFVPISYEALQDAQNIAQEVATMMAFELDAKQAIAFATGSGSGQPTGIITALTGTASAVAAATADTYALADVYALDEALPARYRMNASWLAHRAIANLTRRFDTNGGAGLWTQLGSDTPAQLLGRPFHEVEAMDSTVTALATNFLLLFGDFRNYVIVDRIGTTVRFIPDLFGSNGRPTGQSGWLAHVRVGADSVNDGAFRMLNA